MAQNLIHLLSARTWGGTERYALDICRHFASQGWKASIFTRDIRLVDSVIAGAGLRVRHAPFSGYSDIATAFALARSLRRNGERFVVHAHSYRDAFMALLARKLARRSPGQVRVVMTCHRAKAAKQGRLLRRIYRNLDAHIFISSLARQRFLSTWPDGDYPFPEERLHTLGASLLTPPEPTPLPDKGPAVALYIGRLSPEKGIETLISSLAPLRGRRVRLCIAGTGYADYLDSLHRLASAEGVLDLIDWKGWVPDVAPLLAQARFCVTPAIWEEPFSLAALESISAARPVIFTCQGSQNEILHPVALRDTLSAQTQATTGTLTEGGTTLSRGLADADSISVRPGNREELTQAIALLASDRELCARMGENGRRNYEDSLSWPRFAARIEKIYTPTK